MDIAAEFVAAAIKAFDANKRPANRVVEQVPDEGLHVALDENRQDACATTAVLR